MGCEQRPEISQVNLYQRPDIKSGHPNVTGISSTGANDSLLAVEFVAYPDNSNICVVTTVKTYLDRTSALRGGAQQLFVSYSKPFKPVSRETISRWVKTVMEKSGIDVNLFKPHSTRVAATSKAFIKSVSLEHILSVAGWSSVDTFAKFHKKSVINTDSFSTVLLQD